MRKILIIGAGNGGQVTLNILLNQPDKQGYLVSDKIIGFADDDPLKPGVICNTKEIVNFWDQDIYFIVSITSDQVVRKSLFELLPIGRVINVIHCTAYIEDSAVLGTGNVIGAHCYIGHESIVGDNNLLSSNTHIEHHNKVGSHNVFGPNVNTSGSVTIGDMCLLGAGCSVMPKIKLGNNVRVASNVPVWTSIGDKGYIKWNKNPTKIKGEI